MDLNALEATVLRIQKAADSYDGYNRDMEKMTAYIQSNRKLSKHNAQTIANLEIETCKLRKHCTSAATR